MTKQDRVRVLRVLEYEGPRDWVKVALIAEVEALRKRLNTSNIVDGFLAATAEKNLVRAETAEARAAILMVELENLRNALYQEVST